MTDAGGAAARGSELAPMIFAQVLQAGACEGQLAWRPFHPGIEIALVYQDERGPAAAFLRYQPGARVGRHVHEGYEHVLVLRGSQTDAAGRHVAGTLVVNPPGSVHEIVSEDGCLVLVIWEKPVRFV